MNDQINLDQANESAPVDQLELPEFLKQREDEKKVKEASGDQAQVGDSDVVYVQTEEQVGTE
jgi:hypothetical protein